MQEKTYEQLVDIITERVQRELAARGTAVPEERKSGEPLPCHRCAASSHCDSKAVEGGINAGATRVGAVGVLHESPCSFVAPMIDHTLLKPDATREDLRKVCEEARKFGFATVCVNSANVRFVAACLEGSAVKPIAVVGFPLGAATSGAKGFETREAIRNGAREIDMVINIGALKSKDYRAVLDDIRVVVEAAQNMPVKVILETSMLNKEEKTIACALAKAAGATFVKTSTGFGGGGATPEDVALMRAVVGDDMGVKASGGVRNFDDAARVIEAGASRIGASASIAIVQCVRGEPKTGDVPSRPAKKSVY